ncbi:MAG: rRNA maturation RNase YbeY [Planctomycetota bacterium]|jgi:probable rRNA maturation factor
MNEDSSDNDIIINLTKNWEGIDFNHARIEELVRFICKDYGTNNDKTRSYEVNIVIVDDAEIRKMNKSFRKSDTITDCLSFDLSEKNNERVKNFEIIVNAEKASREAQERGHSPESELALYITHGLLHNLGFKDETEPDAKKMHETEDKILQQLGFGLVYNNNRKKK